AFGDLNGDDQVEAAVDVWCTNGGGTVDGELSDNFVVFQDRPNGGRKVLGIVTTTQPASGFAWAWFSGATIAHGKVVVNEDWHGPYDGSCCPSGRATTVWTWNGTNLVAGQPKITRPVCESVACAQKAAGVTN